MGRSATSKRLAVIAALLSVVLVAGACGSVTADQEESPSVGSGASSYAEVRFEPSSLTMSFDELEMAWSGTEQQSIGFGFQSEILGIEPQSELQTSQETEATIGLLINAFLDPEDSERSTQAVALIGLLANTDNLGPLGVYLRGVGDGQPAERTSVSVKVVDQDPQTQRIDLTLQIDHQSVLWSCEWLLFYIGDDGLGYHNLAGCSGPEMADAVEILTDDSDVAMDALNTFTLHYDADQNCLYHDEPDNNGEPGTGGRVAIIWPSGFTAVADESGVSVLDATGTPVAHTDVTFQIGGGAIPADTDYCDAIGMWVANGPPMTP